jgi:hypothetical protein
MLTFTINPDRLSPDGHRRSSGRLQPAGPCHHLQVVVTGLFIHSSAGFSRLGIQAVHGIQQAG